MKTRHLEVWRRLSTGERVHAGELAQNRDGVFFQYDADYLERGASLSPFALPFDADLHKAPRHPHEGLHGVFADSLPDGWGRLVMDRVFRRQGVMPSELTPMDRLAYVADRGMGALEYAPASSYIPREGAAADLHALAEHALALFDGTRDEVPAGLSLATSSGGARPKAVLHLPPDGDPGGARTTTAPGLEPWLVKFTSASLPLGHEESLCEAAYLAMARAAGIETADWRLIPAAANSPAIASLACRRFDCAPAGGRYHMLSLSALLDADFRAPSMDYENIIKASQLLCDAPAIGRAQFARAMFNLFAVNQDDHTRNWAFLQTDAGQWQPTPFYDVTFSPSPSGEHMAAYRGHGRSPPLAAVQELARRANFGSWAQAQQVIERVVDAISRWPTFAEDCGVSRRTQERIFVRLKETRRENKHLLPQSGIAA